MRRNGPKVGWVVMALLACAVRPTVADPASDEELRRHFQEGIDHYQRREFDLAAESFERFLAGNPSSWLAADLLDDSGRGQFAQMLGREDLDGIARRVLDLGVARQRESLVDNAVIESLVGQILTAREYNPQRGEAARRRLEARDHLVTIGEPAVPFLVDQLVDRRHDEIRAYMQVTLRDIGRRAVLPAIEALDSPEPLVRESVATVLGQIGDRRALPALRHRWDIDESPRVREVVARAIRTIARKSPDELPPAVELYYALAEGYYRAKDLGELQSFLFEEGGPLAIVWRWIPERDRIEKLNLVTYTSSSGREYEGYVPAFAYNELVAEEACFDALAIDPHYEPAIALLVSIYVAQQQEVGEILRGSREKLSPRALEVVEGRREHLARADLFARTAGARYVNAALHRALRENDPAVADALMRILEDLEGEDVLPGTTAAAERMGRASYETFFPRLREPIPVRP